VRIERVGDERTQERGPVDVAHGGSVEKGLTAFVERRDGQRRKSEGERLVEEAWMES
jgi:hypothetical protein